MRWDDDLGGGMGPLPMDDAVVMAVLVLLVLLVLLLSLVVFMAAESCVDADKGCARGVVIFELC